MLLIKHTFIWYTQFANRSLFSLQEDNQHARSTASRIPIYSQSSINYDHSSCIALDTYFNAFRSIYINIYQHKIFVTVYM